MHNNFKKAEKRAVKFAEDIKAMLLMRNLGVSKDQRANVLGITRNKLDEKPVASALRALYPDGTTGGSGPA